MNIVKATLVKRRTEDGLVEMREDVPLGKTYEVEAESLRTVVLYNSVHRVFHEKEIIDEISGRWLPVECLRIEQERKFASARTTTICKRPEGPSVTDSTVDRDLFREANWLRAF